MPEYTENITGGKTCRLFLDNYPDTPAGPPPERILLSLHADSTNKEASRYPADSPVCLGHVFELSPDYEITRGMPGADPLPLYPPMYTFRTGNRGNLIAIHGLAFVDVILDSRNYILKFMDKKKSDCWVQVRIYARISILQYIC